MNITKYDQLKQTDFSNGAIRDEIRTALGQLEKLKELIEKAHNQAVEVGTMFQFIRIGEDHPKTSECRRALDEVYTPLAKIIDSLYEQIR